ncbi:YHYH protein [Ekhidna sp.]|uniref:YHYH protein n=1 Tax=Ekhidna sp. TaxID=2608089 RepID=UPI00329774B3
MMITKNIPSTLLVTAMLLCISCGGDDEAGASNSNPESFTVTVNSTGSTSATISWTASNDGDGDEITYDVQLGTSLVSEGQSIRMYDFTDLDSSTDYSGSVVAKDGNGGTATANFSFTTTTVGENQNPESFTVTVETISHNAANISWTASVDADGDDVTYTIELNSEEISTGETGTTYSLTSLASGVSFGGKVIADDGNGGTAEAAFDFTSYVVDITQYTSMPGYVTHSLVDCSYSEGGSGKCYEITFNSNPVNDDGPFCPETTFDVGGFGNYDGDTNPGFQVMKAALFEAMEMDGYDIIADVANMDGSFDINIETVVPGGGIANMGGGGSTAACLEPTPDDGLTLTFQIPVIPTLIGSPDNIESVEYVGLALDGVPINGAPPSVVGNSGKIPSLDRCGGHHDPAGYYHWHFLAAHMDATLDANGLLDTDNGIQCSNKTQSSTALVGYARDGYPIYSGNDDGDVTPTGLDGCNGHTAVTADYPDGIYHYHASTDITNVPPCILGKQSIDSFDKPM